MSIPEMFSQMKARYRPGVLGQTKTFYFSIGEHKYTLTANPDGCEVEPGKTLDNADVVLKTTPELFEKMVFKGKMPGPIDIARGKIKTNDAAGLAKLRDLFDFSGL